MVGADRSLRMRFIVGFLELNWPTVDILEDICVGMSRGGMGRIGVWADGFEMDEVDVAGWCW